VGAYEQEEPVNSASTPAVVSVPQRDSFAEALRGFGPIGILSIVVIGLAGNDHLLPVSALLIFAWAWRSHTPLSELGFVRPRSWILTVVGGIVCGVAFKFLMKAIVMPLLGAPPINQTYHYLAGNTALMPRAVWTMIVAAGFGEEVFFRGFLFERLRTLFALPRLRERGGSSRGLFGSFAKDVLDRDNPVRIEFGRTANEPSRTTATLSVKVMIVSIVSVLFALAHYSNQGLPGTEQAMFTGLAFGTFVALTGRIWDVMFAHAAFDLTALAMIYWNLETVVAHLVFK
jgi:membrane protease YdiL (CAAX protease family)